MRVFISWSGKSSKAIAAALYDWLPNVIQDIEPWMSSESIDTGARWLGEVSSTLDESKCGILCLTPDNLDSRWLNFEAGALGKVVSTSRVCPVLYQIKKSDVTGPLTQFQMTDLDEPGVLALVKSINRALGDNARPDVRLDISFKKFWPDLRDTIGNIPKYDTQGTSAKLSTRSPESMLQEILEIMRDISREGVAHNESRSRQDELDNQRRFFLEAMMKIDSEIDESIDKYFLDHSEDQNLRDATRYVLSNMMHTAPAVGQCLTEVQKMIMRRVSRELLRHRAAQGSSGS